MSLSTESEKDTLKALPNVDIPAVIMACKFGKSPVTRVYWPADDLKEKRSVKFMAGHQLASWRTFRGS